MTYPIVRGEFETARLLNEGYSLARFGDGELKMSYGASYSRQIGSPQLSAELRRVIAKPPKKLLVGIPTMDPRGPKYENWTRHIARFEPLLSGAVEYCSAFVTRPDSAPWLENPEFCGLLASVWRGKRAVVLCERGGSMLRAVRPEAGEAIHIEAPRYGAYDRIDRLEDKIIGAKPEVAILSAGPAATCLAYRLTKQGIQAVDLGSAGAMIVRNLYAA